MLTISCGSVTSATKHPNSTVTNESPLSPETKARQTNKCLESGVQWQCGAFKKNTGYSKALRHTVSESAGNND